MKGFMIVYAEMNPLIFYIPPEFEAPVRVYKSVAEAKAALESMRAKFDSVALIQYGEAFPYENTSFDQTLAQKGYALWGFGSKKDEEDEPFRVAIALREVDLA
jgi:hypothetical protein